jgi:sugar phosphate isomerase/epimerase
MIGPQVEVGVVAAALAGGDVRQAAPASRRAGFRGLQFDAHSRGLDLTQLSQSGRREFRHVLSSSDQQLIGLRVDAGAKGFGPGADIDQLLSRFAMVMEAAKGLGTPLVCAETGPLPEPATAPKPRPAITPEQAGLIIIPDAAAPAKPQAAFEPPSRPAADPAIVAQVDAAMVELGSRADRLGVTVALRSDLASFASLDRALAAAACPWFGIDLDPVSILRDLWSIDEVFSRLGSLIRHVRGRDAVLGADRRTRPALIGQGSTNWGELMASLDAAGYRGWLTIDSLELPDRAGAAIAAAELLRKLRP